MRIYGLLRREGPIDFEWRRIDGVMVFHPLDPSRPVGIGVPGAESVEAFKARASAARRASKAVRAVMPEDEDGPQLDNWTP